MIRINLLSEGKKPTAVRRPKIERGPLDLGLYLLVGTIFLALALSGLYWWWLSSKVDAKNREIRGLQAEYEKLKPIIDEVNDFKDKKADLEHKIDVITDLKANQRGPVHVMDSLSRSLPELLWLTDIELSSSQIKVRGQAFNTNAIASFIENLEEVEEFDEPVPGETKPVPVRGGEVFTFQLTVPYRLRPLQSPVEDEAEDGDGLAELSAEVAS